MKFEITRQQQKQVATWLKAVHKEVIEQQRQTMEPKDFALLTCDGEVPYYGAMGGGLTYSFSNTSLGMVVKVKESITGKELDLTNYDAF